LLHSAEQEDAPHPPCRIARKECIECIECIDAMPSMECGKRRTADAARRLEEWNGMEWSMLDDLMIWLTKAIMTEYDAMAMH
jgi:polyferredoxin